MHKHKYHIHTHFKYGFCLAKNKREYYNYHKDRWEIFASNAWHKDLHKLLTIATDKGFIKPQCTYNDNVYDFKLKIKGA